MVGEPYYDRPGVPARAPLGNGASVVDDADIFRAAKLVIDQRGEDAALFAAGRADVLLEEGHIDGAPVWRRILAAIEELKREGGWSRPATTFG